MFEECFERFRSSPFGHKPDLQGEDSPTTCQVNLEGRKDPFCCPRFFELSYQMQLSVIFLLLRAGDEVGLVIEGTVRS